MNKEQALELLQGLGETAEEVAANLQAKGIQGHALHARSCPISRFLKANGADGVATSPESVFLYPTDGDGNAKVDSDIDGITINQPKAIGDFICMFDNGKFPALRLR